MGFRPVALVVALTALSVDALGAFVRDAHAADGGPSPSECIKASEEGLATRDRNHLRDARKSFVTCASDSCPKALRIDCARWLEDVDSSLPTVVFGAKDARGSDLFDVTVLVDGERVVGHEQGKALPLDPGPHLIRFERKDRKPVEERVLLRAGERNRPITAHFEDSSPLENDKDKGRDKDKDREKDSSVPIISYVLGAVGVVGIGGFAFFGIVGSNEKDRLRTSCSPSCTDSDVSHLKTDFIIADVSLGVGIVALGLATYFLLTNDSPAGSATSRTGDRHQRFARTIWK